MLQASAARGDDPALATAVADYREQRALSFRFKSQERPDALARTLARNMWAGYRDEEVYCGSALSTAPFNSCTIETITHD